MGTLKLLQKTLKKHAIGATIIPSTDPHGSEYVAEHWQGRKHFSQFTGSAGTLVATQTEAALWTDSRYYLQAAEELKPQGIELMKDGMSETPTIIEWIEEKLPKGSVVSLCPELFSIAEFDTITAFLAKKEIKVSSTVDIINEAWKGRPERPTTKIFNFNRTSGKSSKDKISWLRDEISKHELDGFVLTTLDDIAWLLNIRGRDIDYNPLVISYLYLTQTDLFFFVDSRKVDREIADYFQQIGIKIKPYEEFFRFLSATQEQKIGVDFRYANFAIIQAIGVEKAINYTSPVALAKSQKNRVELMGFRRAMIKDGVALVKLNMWIEESMKNGEPLTELSVSKKLHDFRAIDSDFICDSFETISAYGSHSAIVHYEPTEHSDIHLKNTRILLLDSGGHYYCGTTDITRTLPLGPITPLQKHDYTLVLKGVIALSAARFPQGTRGSQLDVLARQFLWQDSKNFGHGTGHGVGHCLCVHEGPQSIRMQENPQPLLSNMIISNEPAIYYTNRFGIRLENLIAVRPSKHKNNNFGKFFEFETLTLYPFDKRCIDKKLLSPSEIQWIDDYHNMCYEKLSPHLSNSERKWLKARTQPIK